MIARALALTLLLGCSSQGPAGGPPATAAVVFPILVLSGRPPQRATRALVAVGSPVVLQLEGLGPPKAVVLAPDGSPMPATEAPLVRNRSVVGTEVRFVPRAPGAYRVELSEVPGEALALLDAR